MYDRPPGLSPRTIVRVARYTDGAAETPGNRINDFVSVTWMSSTVSVSRKKSNQSSNRLAELRISGIALRCRTRRDYGDRFGENSD